MNQTPNYQLSQWERSDKVQMEDFNADNAKIDAAIKAETDARKALAARSGNCQLWTTSYIGTGEFRDTSPNTVTFPKIPVLVMVISPVGVPVWLLPGVESFVYLYPNNSASSKVRWNDNTVIWYGGDAARQLNELGKTYYVVALLAADQ